MLVFMLHGTVVSTYLSRLPEIQLSRGIQEAAYGLALAGIPVGVFSGSFIVGMLVERYGTRRMILFSHPFIAATPLLSMLAYGPGALFLAMFVFGLAMAASNIAMNIEADRVEAATGRKIINKCHGAWGVGSLTFALLAPLFIKMGIGPLYHYIFTWCIVALGTLFVVTGMQPSPPRQLNRARSAKRVAMPNMGTFLVVAFALTALWYEGVIRNWGVIYLRDEFGAAAWVAALALPALLLMQTVMRLAADGLIDRHGEVLMGRVLVVIAGIGLLLLVTTNSIALALFAIVLIGLGTSTGWPQAVSAAARWGDRPSSENVAAFSILQTVVIFVAPPITGFLASAMDLRMAMAMFLPVPIISFIFAKYLAPRDPEVST